MALADSFEHVAAARGGRTNRDAAISLADPGSPTAFFNVATLLRPALGREWDAVQDRVESFFGSGHGGGVLSFSPWPVPPAARSGWELVGHPPLMVRMPNGPPPSLSPTDLRISEVSDDEMLSAFEAVLVDGYPLPELSPARPGCLFDGRVLEDGTFRCWIGSVGGRAVAAASAHVGEDAAFVSWLATVPEFRGRGYGAALTSAAVRAAPQLPALLIASDPGRPVYERLGFLRLLRFTAWLWRERTVIH